MSEINDLIAKAAQAAESAAPLVPTVDPAHAREARAFVWDRHFYQGAMRASLDERLANSSAAFKATVAATELMLADELAESNIRRAEIRAEYPKAEYPTLFLGEKHV